jgi:DNA polymerase III alpha subunit
MSTLLRCASRYSFLFGTLSVRELCERAVRAGIVHLGLCDWGGLYGVPELALQAERVGLHALYGVELGSGGRRLFALARDEIGFRSLCRLGSGYREADGDARLLELVGEQQEGLWLLCDQAAFLSELVGWVDRERVRVALPLER